LNRKVLSLDLKTDRKSLIRTVCGSEFHTDGADNRRARLEKSVLMNRRFLIARRFAIQHRRQTILGLEPVLGAARPRARELKILVARGIMTENNTAIT